jgi:hypothetical protein
MTDDLWAEDTDDLNVQSIRRAARTNTGARHIGCPLWWFTQVYPAVRGKGELAVALYLYRLRVIQRSCTVKVSNERLSAELGIDRFTKKAECFCGLEIDNQILGSAPRLTRRHPSLRNN